MMKKMLYACCVMVFIGAIAEVSPVSAASDDVQRKEEAAIVKPSMSELNMRSFKIPANTPHKTVYYDVATGQGGVAASTDPIGSEDPVYVNEPPMGSFAFAPGAGRLIADDIITVAVGGCSVTGYELLVSRSVRGCSINGQACETDDDCGGSQTCDLRADPGYTVNYGIYDGCPMAGGQLVPGTEGVSEFIEDGTNTIIVKFAEPTPLDSSFWIGVEFDKDGAGWIVGTPASRGFTENVYDFPIPFFACQARFSGSPIYAGFHARVFCSPEPPFETEFLAYYNPELIAPTFAPGANAWIVDDVELIVDECTMTSFEVGAVGGGGPFTVNAEIWRLCSQATKIDGTEGSFDAAGDGSPELARFEFDPPVDLGGGANYFVAWRYSSSSASAILAEDPTLGSSDDLFGLPAQGGCFFFFGGDPIASFTIAIRCLGDAPVGACCNISTIDDPGDIAACTEVSEISCQGQLLRYAAGSLCPNTCTVDGTTCDETDQDPDNDCAPMVCTESHEACTTNEECPEGEFCETQFCVALGESFDPACGSSSCCTPPEYEGGGEGCFDLSLDECDAIEDSNENKAVWSRGATCDNPDFNCPLWQCRFAEGNCDQPNSSPGCNDPTCCDRVCQLDPFCCDPFANWDQACADLALDAEDGCALPLTGDDCIGALFVDVSSNFCGNNPGQMCDDDSDCAPGTCLPPFAKLNTSTATTAEAEVFCCPEIPGGALPGAVWTKFVAPASSIEITTSDGGPGDASDSVLQLFEVGDNSDEPTACSTLRAIACDDDSGVGSQAKIVAHGLSNGSTYYVALAPRDGEHVGTYNISFEHPATDPDETPSNDLCSGAVEVTSAGAFPLDVTGAGRECPVETCFPCEGSPAECTGNPTLFDNDVWYRYTAFQTGVVTVDTCDIGERTTIVAYEGGNCQPSITDRLGCNNGGPDDCDVSFNVIGGFDQTYLIRVGGIDGTEPTGFLNFSAIEADCNQNLIPDSVDISEGNSEDCQPNGIPDECDGGCENIELIGSVPPNCSIDARQPSDPDGSNPAGWSSILVTFDGDAGGATPGDFSVVSTSGVPPTVTAIAPAGDDATLTLSGPIPAGAYTTITYTPTGASVSLGFLPADVNGDGVAGSVDILALIDSLNGVIPQPLTRTDADRSGVAGAPDILRVIDLLNGAATYDIYLDATLPACP